VKPVLPLEGLNLDNGNKLLNEEPRDVFRSST